MLFETKTPEKSFLRLTIVLGVLSCVGPLSIDLYLASLPSIGTQLQAPTSQVQLTISAYLLGFAFSQLLYGPVSDRFGRRPILLAALGVYFLSTVACASAFSVEVLIAARFFQAVGAAGASVLARAIVRDVFEGVRVARELSRMAAIMALAPLVSPSIGGLLQATFGWRSNFIGLLVFGGLAWLMTLLLLPESLRQRSKQMVSVSSSVKSYREFLRNREFLTHLGLTTCCYAGLFGWISSAAFVLQGIYGLSPLKFGIAFVVGPAGFFLGTMIAARFVMRWGTSRTIGLGTGGMALGGILMVIALGLNYHAAAALLGAMCLYEIGMGLVLPQAQAGAMIPFPERAGAASALIGFITQAVAAVTGLALGHLITQSAWPLAIAMAAAGILAIAIWGYDQLFR
jgi:DHA1 family bicyclomycin/chloramphenicol resistance-like MFS transporter